MQLARFKAIGFFFDFEIYQLATSASDSVRLVSNFNIRSFGSSISV